MSDERWTPEEQAAHEAAKLLSIPKAEPRRRFVPHPGGRYVSAEEMAEFMKELEKE